MKKYSRLPIICLLISLLSTYGQAYADAPVIWAPGGDARLLNSRGLLGADGTVYPRNYLGPKNYLAQGSSRTTGWAVSGAQTLTPVTTGLAEPSIGTGIYIAPGAVGDYAYFNFKIDPSDSTVLQKITWAQLAAGGYVTGYQKADIYSCTVAWVGTSCSGTTTRVPLTTDASSVTNISSAQNFVSYFTAPSFTVAPFLQLRITTVTATGNLTISSVYVGPGQTIQGPNIGPWQTYTPTVAGLTSAYTIAYAEYRRVGDSLQGKYRLTTTATGTGSGQIYIGIPANLTINFTSGSTTLVGSGSWFNVTSTNERSVFISTDGTVNGVRMTPNYNVVDGALVGTSLANGDSVWGDFTVKINEWTTTGTVNLAQNDITYYAPATAGSITIGTVNSGAPTVSAAGSSIPNITTQDTTNGTTDFLILPAGVLQDGDKWSVEVKSGGVWYDGEKLYARNQQGSASYGLIPYTNAGAIYLGFGRAGYSPSTTLSAVGNAWSSQTGNNIRIRIQRGGQAVGFAAYAPGQSSGLVPAVGLPGFIDGSTPCTGCVGETVRSSSSALQLTNSLASQLSISLPAGTWRINGQIVLSSTPTARTSIDASIVPTANANGTLGVSRSSSPVVTVSTISLGQDTLPEQVVNLSATTVYYLNATTSASSTAANDYGYIQATRIR